MQAELSTFVTYNPWALAADTTLGVVTEEMVLRAMLDAMRS